MAGMKKGTIKTILRRKMNKWFESIPDTALKLELQKNSMICGGAITSMLLGEKPHDYDIYFTNLATTMKAAQHYAKKFNETVRIKTSNATPYNVDVKIENKTNIKGKIEERVIFYMKSAGVATETQSEYKYFEGLGEEETEEFAESLTNKHLEELINHPEEVIDELEEELRSTAKYPKLPFRPIIFTDNAVSLSDKTQLITRFYGTAEEIHNNFDFAHAMCAYNYHEHDLYLPDDALEAILSQTLQYRGSLYPISSIFRIRKFIKRGWRISAGQMLKIIWQISDLDLKNIEVLKDQLIGVDMAYMHQLIEELQEVKLHERIDSAYVATLIDKLFDE